MKILTASSVARSAAVMSLGLALFVPYAHPWASLGWAVLACAAAVWAARDMVAPQRPAEQGTPIGARHGGGAD